MKFISLNNGVEIPILGLGVFQTKDGSQTENAVKWALEAGYRHIDTAKIYGNEKSVGKAIKESGVDRKDIFLTTKLWNDDIRQHREKEAFEQSLKDLQTDYVDLYLIHWPVEGFERAWSIMEELYSTGKIRAIGVSNFHQHHLESLKKISKITPALNQIESHPLCTNQPLIDYCQNNGIAVAAWSPLGGTGGNLMQNEQLIKIAEAHQKTVAQIIIRWNCQRNVVVIPKSTHQDRICSNLEAFDFELSADEMNVISGLNQNKRVGPDPDNFDF